MGLLSVFRDTYRHFFVKLTLVDTKESANAMKNQSKYVNDFDLARLKEIVKFSGDFGEKEEIAIRTLENEINNAETVKHKNTPPDVITMNSEVVYKNMSTGRKESLTLVFPNHE